MMKVGGGIKPQVEPHLPADQPTVAAAADVDVGLNSVGLSWRGAEELDVHLVVVPRMSLIVR